MFYRENKKEKNYRFLLLLLRLNTKIFKSFKKKKNRFGECVNFCFVFFVK